MTRTRLSGAAAPLHSARRQTQRTLRRGITQVELLLSIGIIIALASLLLPIIGRAREAARSAQCKDNLHNLSIAAEGYLAQFNTFPAGVISPVHPVRSEPGGDGLSWTVRLLPFVEQMPLYQQLDLSVGVDAQPPEFRHIQIDLFHCPSDRTDRPSQTGGCNYAGAHHPAEAPIDADNRGTFFLGRGISFVDVEDGLSHTLQFGEKDISANDRGWLSGSRATLRNAGTPLAPFDGATALTAAAPPSPLAVGGFLSAHPNGINFTLADGSTRFIAWSIDQTLLQRLADRSDGELVSLAALIPGTNSPAPPHNP
jgi:hypothetical protein